jgi:ACS family hexuronate transporter-like MFS transporter
MSGGSLGALLAPVIMIWLANTVGWRIGFAILGAVGLVWAAAWAAWFRPAAELLHGPKKGSTETRADQWNVIARNPRFWACVAGAAFAIPIIHVVSAWTATYFVQQWKLPVTMVLGGYLFLIGIGRDVGFLLGGGAVTFLTRRGFAVGRARKVVLVVSMVLMAAISTLPWAPGVSAAVVLILILEVGRASYGANFLAFNQDIAPGRVGTIAGWMGGIGALSGGLLVWLIGVISTGSGFTVPFLLIGLFAVLGTVPLLLVDWDSCTE